MELLLSALVTALTQLFKWVAEKVGMEKAKAYTLAAAFVLSLVGTFAWKQYEGAITWSDTQSLISVFGIAVAYYEVVVKRVLKPIFAKLLKK